MNRALAMPSRPIPPDFCHTSYACVSFRRSASALVQLLKQTFAALVLDVHDDVGKSRKQKRSMPKCPIIALVNHVKGDKAPKRHPTQRGTQHCQTAVIYHADKHIFLSQRKLEEV